MRIEEFARTWGPERPRLEAAAARFLADMDQLWAEGDSLTLIHVDLHGDHVLFHCGEPYIIDWGQARYGSFYLDLPNYFAPGDARHYCEALADLGHTIPEGAFIERYRMAGRYIAFKYMGYTLWSYRQGYSRLDRRQWELFDLALNGR
jgi:aminoglycoside phosphotransferase (APT) family kinase protein